MKYDWVPHEVRREQAESVVAYVLVALLIVAVPTAIFVAMALGMLH